MSIIALGKLVDETIMRRYADLGSLAQSGVITAQIELDFYNSLLKRRDNEVDNYVLDYFLGEEDVDSVFQLSKNYIKAHEMIFGVTL